MQSLRGRARSIWRWTRPHPTPLPWNSPPVATPPLGQCVAISCRATDDAHDTRRCDTTILERDAIPIIPIRKNGRLGKEDGPAAISSNEALRATRYSGRAFWKCWTKYHARSRIAANPLMECRQCAAGQRMRWPKAFGERIPARGPDRQTVEIHIPIALMNRFNAIGTAEIFRVE